MKQAEISRQENDTGFVVDRHQRRRDKDDWPTGREVDAAQNRQPASTRINDAARARTSEARDWLKLAGVGVDRQRNRLAASDWVNGVVAEAQPGQRRRRGRQVMSVVKSGAGLRAISETGDTYRLTTVPSSLTADVSHPVIRGLYRQALPLPASSSLASASSSSSAASVTAAGKQCDEDDSSDDSQHSI